MKKIILFVLGFLSMQAFAAETVQSVGLYLDKSGKIALANICLETTGDLVCGNTDKTIHNLKAWKLRKHYLTHNVIGDESCVPYFFWQIPQSSTQGIKLYLKVEKSKDKRKTVYFRECVLA